MDATRDAPVRSVLLMGKGDLAIRAGEWLSASSRHRLAAVVPVVPEPGWCPSLQQWAERTGVPVVTTGDCADAWAVVGGQTIDLAVSIFYDKIMRPDFIGRCGRVVNLHNGPLPRYRGVAPINWALKNEETEHGVTLHEVTPGVDDGPIIGQVKFSIYPDRDEVIDVYRRCLAFGWTLFEELFPVLEHLVAVPQDHSRALHHTHRQDHLLGERRSFRRTDEPPVERR